MTATPSVVARPDVDRRWWILAVLAVAQLMIVVDASIVNIALPHAQRALHITTANRQWVITAYTLTFGGLLLLGGRIADFMGRKRVLLVGLLGFAGASALGGLAPDASLLFAARALQGGFAALMAPAALSLLTVTFTDPRERARAFGVWGAIAGGGLALGLILGGVLTQYASWRWCLLVNTPIALVAGVAAFRLIPESRVTGHTRYDIPGALTSTLGMVTLVYGVTKASTNGWGSSSTLGLLGVAVALLVAFVVIERSSTHPLLPLRVITDRNRGGSFLTTLLVGLGMFGTFLFLTYYLQGTLHYSALKTGFAYLPFSLGVVAGATAASQLILRFRPRAVMGLGLAGAVLGVLWFSRIGVHSGYWSHLFPAELIMSLGMGMVFVPVNNTALTGVSSADAGVASALINTTQQIGGSIGTALLNTIATSVTATYLVTHGIAGGVAKAASTAVAGSAAGTRTAATVAAGTVHGFSVAFIFAAGFLALALVAVTVLVTSKAASGTSPVPLGEGVSDAGEAGEAGDVGVVLLPT
jgi:EmrB/QacA subfamily drug resistance transporter